ncbi:unnamed protein product [Pleuronectes platessa]|uniref:Uncharacterized protein n=1 Tax=Pleuronectes platessa TaxID=8262 RepID=A0A9N7Z0W4_PLEPL|nr:unnamed protein product [Pleuronectes platessa]
MGEFRMHKAQAKTLRKLIQQTLKQVANLNVVGRGRLWLSGRVVVLQPEGHFGVQMGQNGDRTADLQIAHRSGGSAHRHRALTQRDTVRSELVHVKSVTLSD